VDYMKKMMFQFLQEMTNSQVFVNKKK